MTAQLDTVIATLRSWQTPSVDTAGGVSVSAPAISANGTAAPNGTGFYAHDADPDTSLAFQHSGRQGEQRTADYGSAGKSRHQQYFTPQWVAECFPEIVTLVTQPHGRPASVLDPTGGVGRLLAVFKGHPVLGIELDESMATVAKRVLGKEQVRSGDILAYAPYLEGFDVAALNPPYDLRWQPLPGQSFEMTAGSGLIESQKATLEIATKALQGNGILIGLFSRRFFEVNADAREYLFRKYTVLALIDLPDAYKPEYGIEAASVLVVALRSAYPSRSQEPITGIATDRMTLLHLVGQAAAKLPPWQRVYPYGMMPTVPHLEMAVEVDTTPTLQVSARGVRAAGPWAALWAGVLDCTVPGYSPAEGSQSGLFEGVASLPNLLLGGIDPNLERLRGLGFDVACDDQARVRLEGARKRFERERLPLRLDPVELLAYYDEGWYTAEQTIEIGKHTITAGQRYHLTLRWQRATEHVKSEVKEDRKDVLHTYVDLGYSVFELRPADGSATIVLKETSVEEMQALITALGAPTVKTAAELPDIPKWRAELTKLQDKLADRNGGLRLYAGQREDVLLLATRGRAGLYYEQGGGKTPVSAHWASLRGYQRVLVVCPSFLAPNWMEELGRWGFPAVRLDHRAISQIRDEKRQGVAPAETTFYVCTYEQLKLSDPAYEPWSHAHFDKKGELIGVTEHITAGRCPDCDAKYASVVTQCPKCQAARPDWNGARCEACGFQGRYFQADKSHTQWPFYKRVQGLFGAVILDESQVAKSKTTQVAQAVRALNAKGRLVLSGTPMKGYVTDLFWTTGWLLGFGSPLWPFPYQRGSARFLHQFGTFQFVTREFEDTLSTGKRRLVPAVSNLTRLWRLLSPTSIRRLKADFLPDLPAKQRHIHHVPMDKLHAAVYYEVAGAAKDILDRELRRDDPNMGAISKALWWMRYAASVPSKEGLPYFENALGELGTAVSMTMGTDYPKVRKVVDLVQQARAKGEKTIVFTSLRAFHGVLCKALKEAGCRVLSVTAETSTQKRVEKAWELRNGYDVLVASTNCLNRGVTITEANHVIITNLEWSPEVTEQAEDRVHRPGQTKEVHVHYVLTANTVDGKMLDLVGQKSAALHSVLDRVAQDTDVAALLEHVAEENAMLQVARAILADPEPVPALVDEAAAVPVVEIVPAANADLAVVPEPVAAPVEAAPAPAAEPATPRQLPLFGQLLAHVSKPKRRPQPVDHRGATQLSLFGHFAEGAVSAAA